MLISFYKQILQILALMDIMSNVPLPNTRLGYADWDLCLCSALYPSCSVNVPSIFCLCFFYVLPMFRLCSVRLVQSMFLLCSVYVPSELCLCSVYSLHSCFVPCMFLLCPVYVLAFSSYVPAMSVIRVWSFYVISMFCLHSHYVPSMFPGCVKSRYGLSSVCLSTVFCFFRGCCIETIWVLIFWAPHSYILYSDILCSVNCH